MFGQSAFGSQPSAGGFGQPATSTFGQPAQTTNMFGAQPPKPTFGAFGSTAQPAATGGLFGATSQPGGMFGSAAATPATNTFGAGAFGQQQTGAFGASSAFKPAATGGFGATTTTQSGGLFGSSFSAAPAQTGGLFGSTTQPTAQFGGGTSAFGAAAPQANTGFGGGLPAFGQQDQPGTGHVKFNPLNGSDTMMKGGVQSQISTRHQCITCMKEYENKSLEELRCEDYEVGRKGPGAGPAPAAGGMFGAAQPATGGMFGAAASTASAFGQSTPNKPLFGTSGFGAAATTAPAPAFGGFGAQTSQAGGLFGAKPTAFGAPAATTAAPAFGFGSTTTQAGGMFGQPAKPFGAVAPTFGAAQPTNTAFGAAPTSTGFGGFGAATAQPATSIGLFGSQPAKPAFGFGTSAPASTSGFGGFGATSTAGGGLFGSTQPAKPAAFTGFGAATAPASTTGFGGFGAASSTGGGLFGNTQAKTGFSFGGTSTAPATGFGGFGTTTNTAGGGMFGGGAKPGGLFGGTSTGFGAGTGFGATTGFGTSAATGFGGATGAPAAAPPATQSSAITTQHLLSLAASPYGENPLFKSMLSDTNRRQEVLKPTNPAAQKALAANTYKVSPHRNVKIRMKPKDDNDKSAIFEGLDDGIMAAGEIFIPRTSVKKLVLRSRPSDMSNNSITIAAAPTSEDTDVDPDKSLTIGLHEIVPEKKVDEQEGINDTTTNVDDSFAALNPRKKAPVAVEEVAAASNESQEDTVGEVEEVSNNTGSSVVTLTRDGYYTIPPVKDLVLDSEGNCMVTGFTIGREGYGNIHYPGSINVAGLNLDDNVFIRHKEVIVYPDDTNKPALGEGLNRKALITLDKVWPNDKSTGDTVRSPSRLRSMGYEEKLERASARLGARFIEYRPETGSWVFKVDHFSKYGLDDSDGEDNVIPDNVKKFKTLEKRPEVKSTSQVLDNNAKNIVLSTNDNAPTAGDKDKVETDGEVGSDGDKDVEMEVEPAAKSSMVRSALFSDEMDTSRAAPSFTKPVILQQRVASLTLQPRLIENIANSVLGNPNPYPTRGLGGNNTSVGNSFSMSMSSTLGGGSMLESSMPRETSKGPRRQLASYSLQGGYERFVPLATGGAGESGTVVVPRYQDAELPLDRSLLAGKWGRLGDAGLVMGKAGRVGWGNCWDLVTVGPGLGDSRDSCLGDVSFSTLTNTTCGPVDSSQVSSLEQWFNCALSTSTCALDEVGSPVYAPDPSLDTLHEHAREALRQRGSLGEASLSWSNWVEGTAAAWQLMVALWGRLEAEQVTGEETVETHKVTIARRDALSRWLQQTVAVAAKGDLEAAKLSKSPTKVTLANLSGGDVAEACAGLQARGEHRAALLVAQAGGGGEAARMLNQQLSRWTEVHADSKMAEERVALFSLVAGSPVWEGTKGRVNSCKGLEWKRALASHLWYLTHPLSSVGDALHQFRLAWEGSAEYCQPPRPDYPGADQGHALDLCYLLIKLYTDRSTTLEDLLNPASHAPDQLDYRLSWFIHRVLTTLGYRHLPTHALERLHRDAASQAERLGLWHWAAFVLCHLEEPTRRREAVESLLERNVASLDGEREDFLVQELGLPLQWIARARATLARAEGRHKDRAECLLLAERWQEAHEVIVKEIAPEAVIGQEYDYLHRLLGQLAPADISEHIPGWSSQGQVYYQFISIERSVESLLATRDEASVQYELERLRPSVSQLVRAVGTIPATTARERLAQSEIAKKVAHLMRAVHSVFEGAPASGSTARQLAESLSGLPLPEDYALQELRCLTRSYMREIA